MYPVELIIIKPNKELEEIKANFGGEILSYEPRRYSICDLWVQEEKEEGRYAFPLPTEITDVDLEAVFKEYPEAQIFLCDEEGAVLDTITIENKSCIK